MQSEYAELLAAIAQLPNDWHLAGSVSGRVLDAIVRHSIERQIAHSVETGSGKTTLLFSHLSRSHKVFAKENENRSITVVRESPLLDQTRVEFIEGPTQVTLPQHNFEHRIQLALIDGPHGYPFPELEYLCLYPHLDTNGLLIVDDIQIPTIHRLFEFLREDEMFHLLEVVGNTAFFRRTAAPMFDPLGDGWWLQKYNDKRFPIGPKPPLITRLRTFVSRRMPPPLRDAIRRMRGH